MRRLERFYVSTPALRPGSAGGYALAVGAAAAATAVRMAVDPYVTGIQYITFFPAIILTSFVSGFRAGFACLALSVLAGWIFILPPAGGMAVDDPQQILTVAFFVAVGTIDVLVIGALRFAIEKYRELNDSLETRVAARSAELVQAQRTLARAQKMEAIGQLTGGLAHDFNNMLAVVVANVDIARRRLGRGNTDIARQLDNAMNGARRAAELTQRLLAFARNQPLAPESVDLNDLVRGMGDMIDRTLGERVQVECITAAGLWRARLDPSQMESALLNLAVNARDAMPEGGRLTIETGNAYLDDNYVVMRDDVVAGQYVMVAVSDTGIGMSAEVAERAVEPFFTTKPSSEGSGLGLSQVYGFVKQSGGHMAIYSEPGQGTTVRLYLPRDHDARSARQAGEQPAAEERAPGRGSETVLVVEDEERVRRSSVESLRELGYTVLEAASGSEALSILAERPDIDLLFTDVVMAEMNGRRLADTALSQRPDLKVLFTTGYTRNAIVHDSRLDPDVALIVKPFTVDQLARKMRTVLDGR